MAAYTELRLSPEMEERVAQDPTLRAFKACFRIFNPVALAGQPQTRQRRSFKTAEWRTHKFDNGKGAKIICSTAKGAGGTGKTTLAVTQACAQVLGANNSLLINTDSQPSCEERVLGKMLHTFYNGSWEEFMRFNDMQPFTTDNGAADQAPCNIKDSLQTLFRSKGDWRSRIMPPKLVAVDFTRLCSPDYADQSNSKRLYVMLSHEDVAVWDQTLSESRVWMDLPNGSGLYKAAFGAFYALAKMCAYICDTPYVFVDLGPGNGIFNRNILCSSHGIFLPLTIESKAESTLTSMGIKLPMWMAEWEVLSSRANTQENEYHVPSHRPKILGVIFTRLGARGAVRPYNQLLQLLRCYEVLDGVLMPAAMACGMLIQPQVYRTSAVEVMNVLHAAGIQALNAVPAAHSGVVGMLRDFDALAHMAERECVPVPFLQPHHFRTLANLNAATMAEAPNEVDFLVPVPATNAAELNAKVANIRAMVDIFVGLVAQLENGNEDEDEANDNHSHHTSSHMVEMQEGPALVPVMAQ